MSSFVSQVFNFHRTYALEWSASERETTKTETILISDYFWLSQSHASSLPLSSTHIRNINNNYFEISELLITVIFMQCRVERLAVGEAKESHGRAQHFRNEFNSFAIVAVFTICSRREVENMESF